MADCFCLRIRRPPRRAPGGLLLLLAVAFAVAAGCGVLTIIPLEDLRQGNPAGKVFSAAHAPYRSGEVIFSHEAHFEVPCATCHPARSSENGPESGPEDVDEGGLPSMARCFECHKEGDLADNACETCHQLERKGRKPSTHGGEWPRLHGRNAREEEYQCALCHVEPDCRGCHSTRMPVSHTLRFLRSTHGRFAIHDRFACATCHEADFCENCHSQPPPDHTPAFLAGGHKQVARLKARSCLTCHRFQPDCGPCHGG